MEHRKLTIMELARIGASAEARRRVPYPTPSRHGNATEIRCKAVHELTKKLLQEKKDVEGYTAHIAMGEAMLQIPDDVPKMILAEDWIEYERELEELTVSLLADAQALIGSQ